MTGLARPTALDVLQREAFAADAAEKSVRARFAVEVERVEAERRHAFRRYAFLKALVDADASAADLDASRAAQRAAAADELDWDEIDAARRPVLDALAPLVDAVHAARTAEPVESDAPLDEEQQAAPLLAALAAFEAWHLDVRGKPFEALFDTYVPETPRVDF